jgi:hypothetical protein
VPQKRSASTQRLNTAPQHSASTQRLNTAPQHSASTQRLGHSHSVGGDPCAPTYLRHSLVVAFGGTEHFSHSLKARRLPGLESWLFRTNILNINIPNFIYMRRRYLPSEADHLYSPRLYHRSLELRPAGDRAFPVIISSYIIPRGRLFTMLLGNIGETSLLDRKIKSFRVLGIEIEK